MCPSQTLTSVSVSLVAAAGDSELVLRMKRDQKRSQQAFGGVSRRMRLGTEAARKAVGRIWLAPIAKVPFDLWGSENVRN
jgi:hypothetical protein